MPTDPGLADPPAPSNWRATLLAALLEVEYEHALFGKSVRQDQEADDCEVGQRGGDPATGRARATTTPEPTHGTAGPEKDGVVAAIDNARSIAADRCRWSWRPFVLAHWLGGGRIDLAYRYLHSAETLVARTLPAEEIYARAPDLICKYAKALDDKNDSRVLKLKRELLGADEGTETTQWLGAELCVGSSTTVLSLTGRGDTVHRATVPISPGDGDGIRRKAAIYAAALRSAYDILDQNHVELRKLRNALYFGAIVLAFIVAVFCYIASGAPDAIPLCFRPPSENPPDWVCPSGSGVGDTIPGSADVALVALLGLLGASLSSAIFVSRVPSSPHSLTVSYALALFKLPVGSLSALAGILLIHGGFVPGLSQLDTQAQILSYAFVFGFAQQLITGVVDRQAGTLINKIPEKSAPEDVNKKSAA